MAGKLCEVGHDGRTDWYFMDGGHCLCKKHFKAWISFLSPNNRGGTPKWWHEQFGRFILEQRERVK